MAYVRKRGKQLLIVQGIRDSQTGKVGQKTLFTIYCKAEALNILGQSNGGKASQFRYLLERQHPEIKLNWSKILQGIKADIDVLPDLYQYKETRVRSGFREDLCSFARQLMLADPQHLVSAAGLIREHSVELEYLAELIRWRLDLYKQKRSQWNADNAFYWRFAMQETGVPPEIEEKVAGFYNRGEYERASVLFRFLIDCFDDYAEGYNYLGLISLQTEKLQEAIEYFLKGMNLGRRQFPKRIARSRYWSDLATRPYMRAMRNLILALTRAGRDEEALRYCERLEHECGDELSVASYRASIYLNRGLWREAADSALRLQNINPSGSLVAAFALFEIGRVEDAATCFLHGTLNFPRAAKMLVGIRTDSPTNRDEAVDHNAGFDIHRNLKRYLTGRGRKAIAFFNRFLNHPRVSKLISEIEEVKRKWGEEHRTGERSAFDRMMLMQTPEFAAREGKEPGRELWTEAKS